MDLICHPLGYFGCRPLGYFASSNFRLDVRDQREAPLPPRGPFNPPDVKSLSSAESASLLALPNGDPLLADKRCEWPCSFESESLSKSAITPQPNGWFGALAENGNN